MLLLLLSFVFSAAQFLEGGLPAMPEVPEKWERCKDAIPVLPGTIYSQWVKHRKSYSECAWQKFKSMFDFVDSRLRQQKFPCTVTVKQVAKRDDKDTVKTKIEELPPDPVEVNRNILFTKLFCAMVQDENCILQDKEEFGSNDITAYKFFIDADRNGGTNLFLDTSIPKSFLEILFSRNHLDGLCVVSEALTARDRMLTLYHYNQRLMRVNDDIKGFDRLAYSLFSQIVISPPKYLSPSFLPVEHIQEIETFCDDSYESKVRVGAYLLCLSL
ncbi:MAG: hypothetical protein OXC30_00935, partial [Alphaproteobacteria bacterium]|nr:hypothetical protein [Alphaproteobacteria bacterium]